VFLTGTNGTDRISDDHGSAGEWGNLKLDDPVVLGVVERTLTRYLNANWLANLKRAEASAIRENPKIGFCQDLEEICA
jgi:hypothetical protein